MRHLPDFKGYTKVELLEILSRALDIKKNRCRYQDALARRTLAMLFQKTSTRTRVSFEVPMTEMGGHAIYLNWSTSNFILTDIDFETEYLSRNVAAIMARLYHNDDIQKIVSSSKVPVINGCCNKFHPCQALSDIFTIREHWEGKLEEVNLAFIGLQNNVSNSLVEICDKLGINLTLVTPDGRSDAADADVERLIKTSPKIHRCDDPRDAVKNAHFVYTDTWIDMDLYNDPNRKEEREAVIKRMMPFQVNQKLLEGINCKIMHDMPIHPGFEIDRETVRDPRAIIFNQAENRLDTQKGILWWLLCR